jgi:cell division protein FtsB
MKLPQFALTASSVINVVGGLIIIYLLVVLAQTVKHNYDLGRQIEDLRAQTVLLQDQKDSLNYSIQYYKTESFREREARSKLGLQMPGENVVIVPRATATPTPPPAETAKRPEGPRSNFQQWLDFLGGRG